MTGRDGMKVFLTVWFGQLISTMGSGLTGFALGVWVYQETGSVTEYALIALFTALPGILVSPVAGALVDRWDRRTAMIVSDSVAALSTLSIALLLGIGRLELWHIYVAMAVSSTFSALQWPAYSASVSLLVPKRHLGRASGLVQMGQAGSQIVSPVLGGILLVAVGLRIVIAIDFATFLFALLTLVIVRFPRPRASIERKAVKTSLLEESLFGWTYIKSRPGLLGLLTMLALANFSTGTVQVLFTPLVLSFASTAQLGTVVSLAGVGMLLGTIVMGVWGGPARRVYGVLGFLFFEGVVLVAASLRPSLGFVAAGAFLFMFSMPILNGCSQAIWQSKTPPEVQGRVFAMRRMIAWSMLPLAYLLAGPLTDRVFEPLLAAGGPLAGSVGSIIGVGPGRGVAFLYMVLGLAVMATACGGYLYPRSRLVEIELPDVIDDDPVGATRRAVR